MTFGLASQPTQEDLNESTKSKSHEMHHVFIVSRDDSFTSNLTVFVHHSHEVDIEGEGLISDAEEKEIYEIKKD
jgi:hypothetical protein